MWKVWSYQLKILRSNKPIPVYKNMRIPNTLIMEQVVKKWSKIKNFNKLKSICYKLQVSSGWAQTLEIPARCTHQETSWQISLTLETCACVQRCCVWWVRHRAGRLFFLSRPHLTGTLYKQEVCLPGATPLIVFTVRSLPQATLIPQIP